MEAIRESNSSPRKIFVSYAHSDEEIESKTFKFVFQYLKTLEHGAEYIVWNDRDLVTGDDWYEIILEQVDNCDAGVLLIGPGFLNSEFVRNHELPALFEGANRRGIPIFPIFVRPTPSVAVWMSKIQAFAYKVSLVEMKKPQLQRNLSEFVNQIYQKLSAVDIVIEADRNANIDLARLPGWSSETRTNTDFVFVGRDKERQLVRDRWEMKLSPNVLQIVAQGGVGKTAITLQFVRDLKDENWSDIDRVFAWSFYSQGADSNSASSGDFFDRALEFFNKVPRQDQSSIAKAKLLSDTIAEGKNLLILDGLEPLQLGYSSPAHLRGRLKDSAFAFFLRRCARMQNMSGMILISTRVEVSNFLDMRIANTQTLSIDHLDEFQGRAVLRHFGLNGSDIALENLSIEYENHTLSLRLLAGYWAKFRRPDVFSLPMHNSQKFQNLPSKPHRVLDAILKVLDKKTLAVLLSLGLFERPANFEELEAVFDSDSTGHFCDLEKKIILEQIDRLEQTGLVRWRHGRQIADSHPIVRDYLAAIIREQSSIDYLNGHRRISQFLLKQVPNIPTTRSESVQLLSAVPHACYSGDKIHAWKNIYLGRVRQGAIHYSRFHMELEAELASLTPLFDHPYDVAAQELSHEDQALLLNFAGFRLRATGRVRQAEKPLLACYRRWSDIPNRGIDTAVALGNVSETRLMLGKLGTKKNKRGALWAADRAVRLAQNQFNPLALRMCLCWKASILHMKGDFVGSYQCFMNAETAQKKSEGHPYLYSYWGYMYEALLLDLGEFDEVRRRATYSIENQSGLLGDLGCIALGHLTLCNVSMAQNRLDFAENQMSIALDAIYGSGRSDLLPLFQIADSILSQKLGDFESATNSLEDCFDTCNSAGMILHECDTHLQAASLFIELNKHSEAFHHLQSAQTLINSSGYHRRDRFCRDLEDKMQYV